MSDEQPTIAVDFDGTLCKWAFPEIGEPRKHVIMALRMLRGRGWRIIIHSCRVNSHWPESERTEKVADMLAWLADNKVPFHEVWGVVLAWDCDGDFPDGIPSWRRLAATSWFWRFETTQTGKPVADVYLDDRALPAGRGDEQPDSMTRVAEWLASECERMASCFAPRGGGARAARATQDSPASRDAAGGGGGARSAAEATAEELPLPEEA